MAKGGAQRERDFALTDALLLCGSDLEVVVVVEFRRFKFGRS